MAPTDTKPATQAAATATGTTTAGTAAGTPNGIEGVLKYTILGLACLMAFLIRLFAVVRWESVIHEFDPYFNYRTTKYLTSQGFYGFLDWFDDRGWYPLGRIIGGTIYPGLMWTAEVIYLALHALGFTINVRNMCVFLAPLFAANTAIAAYLLVSEVTKRTNAALLAAALVGIVPSYISRSVAGSYDNEGVAIFALVFTFYLWVKAVNTGSLFWSLACALAYFYMVAAWGGYVFIINIIPIYVIIMLVAGRYSARLYIAYSTFYVIGSLLAMQVPFVGFNVIKQAECAASHGVFVLIQGAAIAEWLQGLISKTAFRRLLFTGLLTLGIGAAAALLALQLMGVTQWTGRSLSLLDPTYAKKYIPIISSVSEHQPTSWTSFFFDLHICVPFTPVGLWVLFRDMEDAHIFLILYGTISWYFAGVMVRLMLTLAPAACCLAAIGMSEVLTRFSAYLKHKNPRVDRIVAGVVTGVMFFCLCLYSLHATYASSEAYSSPSIVLASNRGGHRDIIDDFREAYFWLRHNTDENAKIMSWWDYGYQMSAMANRTVIVDNNTWNNTHIATVGRAMASTEEDAYPIMQSLDVDYVLAIFGGVIGYQSDDINKFLWMVRIGGGVYPDVIQENNYYAGGQFRVDSEGSQTLLNCLMYKVSYYRFDELSLDPSRPGGYDRARGVEIGNKGFQLKHLTEAFTSEHWIVRIFKVNKPADFTPTPALEARKASEAKGAPKAAEAAPDATYVGCYTSEDAFGPNRIYGGGPTGANFNLARHHAVSQGKKYFAIARSGAPNAGHAFAFDDAPSGTPIDSNACRLPCIDSPERPCGCSDDYCKEPTPAGEQFNRRWVVYKLKGSARRGKGTEAAAATSAKAAGAGAKRAAPRK